MVPPFPPLPWSMDVTLVLWDAQSHSSNGYFLFFRVYVWGKQAGVTSSAPPSSQPPPGLCSVLLDPSFDFLPQTLLHVSAGSLWEQGGMALEGVANDWHKVSEES